MTEQHKSFRVADLKAEGAGGSFAALVSVFGNVDLGGDRVVKGAFTKSLAKWREAGDPIPVIWNHDWQNPLAHIGKADPALAEETDEGLLIKGSIDLDNPFAAQVHRLMAERRVKELSFGYNVVDSERRDGALDLLELDLIEVGPTLKGMNPATQLLAVKSYSHAGHLAGRSLFARLSEDDALVLKRSTVVLGSQLLADEKAGARLSKETRTAIADAIDLLSSLLVGEASDNPAKAAGGDAALRLQIELLSEGLKASDPVKSAGADQDALRRQIESLTDWFKAQPRDASPPAQDPRLLLARGFAGALVGGAAR